MTIIDLCCEGVRCSLVLVVVLIDQVLGEGFGCRLTDVPECDGLPETFVPEQSVVGERTVQRLLSQVSD